MKDNLIVDFMLKGATQVMTNKMTSDFYAALATKGSDTNELVKGITFAKGSALSYDVIVDAISELNIEDESKIFIVIPNKWKAALRKDIAVLRDYVMPAEHQILRALPRTCA